MFLTACGNSSPTYERLANDATILAFGDSLTYGTGVSRNKSYPAILQSLTNRTVINAGVPGELSSSGVARLPSVLDKHNPDLLILVHGGNDLLRKKDLQSASNNLRNMVNMARAENIPVVMLAVPNPTLILSPASFYETLATDMNVPIDVNALAEILQYPSNKSDAVHPNDKGYHKMAESIYQLLKTTGAI